MHLIPFFEIFPEQGERETRTITTRGYPGLPADEYALVEAYCPDPECDCRRVMINVVGRRQMQRGYLASISYAFDREAEYAGPDLDPINPQSKYAPILFGLVVELVLSQPDYVARLESHYAQMKRAASDPKHPQHRRLKRIIKGSDSRPYRRSKSRPKRRKR